MNTTAASVNATPCKRLRDADLVACDQCSLIEWRDENPYWGINRTKAMHERGTGHVLHYYRVEWPRVIPPAPR